MWKATNEDLLRWLELLSKEKAENEKVHDAEMAEVIVEVKANASMVVWEAKIKLDEDVANVGS